MLAKDSSVRTVLARADWDPAAGVWTVQSSDIAGLVTEVDDLDGLIPKLGELVPTLMEANNDLGPRADLVVVRAYRLGMLADVVRIQLAVPGGG